MANNSVTEFTLSFPFSINDNGNVTVTTDQRKIWADRVRLAVSTVLGERLYRPGFGCNITTYTFDSADSISEKVNSDVKAVFNGILQLLTFVSVDTDFDEATGTMYIEIVYTLPNNTDMTQTLMYKTISGITAI